MPAPTLQNVSRPRAMGYSLALDDRLFRLAVGPGRELSIETAPLTAPRIDTTSSPEEAASADELSLTFARSQFAGGQGLFRAHLEESEADRFWDSKDVSVRPASPGEFPQITLLHTTEVIDEDTFTTGQRMAYDEVGNVLYRCAGNFVSSTSDPLATPPTFSLEDPHDGESAVAVEDLVVLGDETYAALGANGIHQKASGTWSHWSNLTPAKRVWAVKGRVIASDGNSLYELDPAGGAAPSALITLTDGLEWNDVADGGSHILASATDGYVYAFTTDSGSMVLSGQTLFEGEKPHCIGQTQGVVGVGTEGGSDLARWYVGVVNPDNGQLGDLQLVKEWDLRNNLSHQGKFPRTITSTRSALFTGVPDGPAGETHLWRYDVTTGGVSRDLVLSDTDEVWGIVSIDGTMFATVDGAGLFRETDTYADGGWLIGPLGDFYSAADKSWVGARLETGDLADGMAVELHYSTDHDAMADADSTLWSRVTRRDSGQGDPGEEVLSDVTARSLAGMVRLEPSADGLSSPAVRAFSFRAYPSSGAGDADMIVTVPVNVSDQIERPGRGRIRVKGRGASEYATLRGFQGEPVLMRLYQPALTLRGIVESVAAPVQALTSRGSPTVVAQVRIRGRTGGAGVTSGAGPFGTDREFSTSIAFGKAA